MKPAPSLNACFFVGGNHKLVVQKRLSSPNPFIQVQEASCFYGKFRIARKNPCAVLPRPDCVGMQPSPNGAIADGGHNSRLADFGSQLTHAPTRQRNITGGRQFTGKGLNLNDEFWGGKTRGRPGRSRSSRPAKRSSKKRFRHMLTTSRRVSRREAISSLDSPSAAIRIILARCT